MSLFMLFSMCYCSASYISKPFFHSAGPSSLLRGLMSPAALAQLVGKIRNCGWGFQSRGMAPPGELAANLEPSGITDLCTGVMPNSL